MNKVKFLKKKLNQITIKSKYKFMLTHNFENFEILRFPQWMSNKFVNLLKRLCGCLKYISLEQNKSLKN